MSTTPVANLPPVSRTPVANCRRYQRHRRQICHRYQRRRRQILPPVPLVLLTPVANLPPVSTIPAANLPPVSLTPVANNGNNIRLLTHESELEGKNLYIRFLYYPKVTKQNYQNFSDCRFFPFATGVVDTGGKPSAANISANFRKNSKRSYWNTLGLGGN